jgi:hypothetical protein
MKKLLLLMSEPRRKQLAFSMFKNQGDFLNALGGNSHMHQWLKANEPFPYFGFDSFEGIPEDWVSVTGMSKKGDMSVGGVIPQTTDTRIRFIKGWFNETLRPFLRDFTPQSRLIVHSDGDLFSSTMYTLATLDPLLKPGSILIFDEFANPLHEWRAFQDYCSAFGRKCKALGAAGDYYTQVAMEIL